MTTRLGERLLLVILDGLVAVSPATTGPMRLPERDSILNVRGGPPKTPWNSECHDEDPVRCPLLVEEGGCFGVTQKGRYNGSLDLSKLYFVIKHILLGSAAQWHNHLVTIKGGPRAQGQQHCPRHGARPFWELLNVNFADYRQLLSKFLCVVVVRVIK